MEWVNDLGLEKTWIGGWVRRLDETLKIRRLALLFVFSLSLAFLMNSDFDFVYRGYDEGDISANDIKSPLSFEMVDEYATILKKKEAQDSISPIYDYDPRAYENVLNNIYKAFRSMRRELATKHWPKDEIKRLERIKDFLVTRTDFEKMIDRHSMPESLFEWLVMQRFNVRVESTLIKLLDRVSNEKLVRDMDLPPVKPLAKISVRRLDRPGVEASMEPGQLRRLSDVRKMLEADMSQEKAWSSFDKERIIRFAELMAIPNMSLNRKETGERQQQAADNVLAATISVKKGQIVVPEGATVQPNQVMVLEEIERLKSNQRRDLISLVMAILFVSIILIFISYARRFTANKVKVSQRDMLTMATVLVCMVLITKLVLFVSAAFDEKLRSIIPSDAYVYLVPIAAGPMLVGLLISSGEVVWLFSLMMATIVSLLADRSYEFLIFSVVGGIAAARAVFKCRTRNDIYWAGLRTGLVNMLVISALTIILSRDSGSISQLLLWNVAMGFIGGLGSSLVTMMLVPMLESIFNYTTDVKLLELSNLNHPLLKEMIVKAPGTYHHSLVVGSMVEAAAEEIGANPLLAKVSSYYHDIGKMEHAAYFIENQKPGHNPHDHLSPNMSRTVLVAHVKDGVELGEKYKLGQPIIDVIRQHHGTTLISFFYHKAKEAEDTDLHNIEEDDFRYPGPKPQFKEAALSMLADSIEAAARSLDEPTPVRLQTIVKNIIHAKFMDGQLDECNLTLRDLSLIEDAFTRILLGIYHQRIDYPTAKRIQVVPGSQVRDQR